MSKQMEQDIAEWLITHKEGLQEIISSSYRPKCIDIFPDHLIDSYKDIYIENVLSLLKNQLLENFNTLNHEQLLFLDKDWCKLILGDSFFNLPEH